MTVLLGVNYTLDKITVLFSTLGKTTLRTSPVLLGRHGNFRVKSPLFRSPSQYKMAAPQGCLELLTLRKADFILTRPEEPQWLE